MPAQPAQDGQPAKAERPRRESSTYVRQGTACLLAAFGPGAGQRLVEVSARRTGADYCRFMQRLAAAYPQAEKIVLVQDNLNPHIDAVFYQPLPAPRPPASRGITRPKTLPGLIWSNSNSRPSPASVCTSVSPPSSN